MCVSQQFQIFGNSIISFADTSNIVWENDVMQGISQLSRRLGQVQYIETFLKSVAFQT